MSLLSQASLVVVPSGYKEDVVYSVKPTDGSGDLTFTRASDGTRVNSQGLVERVPWNLLEQSNQFDTTWTKTNTSVTNGQSGYDGSSNAWLLTRTNASGNLWQSVSLSGVQTFSVRLKKDTLDWVAILTNNTGNNGTYFNLNTGTQGTQGTNVTNSSIESIGNGWYLCSITLNVSTTAVYVYPAQGDLNVGGSSGSIYIQDAQLVEGSTAKPYFPTTDRLNVPRLDYSGGCPSLLLEPQRTNYFEYSEDYSQIDWTKAFLTVVSNAATSPDGYQNADKIYPSATGGISYLYNISSTLSSVHTISAYVKADGKNIVFLYIESGATYGTIYFDLSDQSIQVVGGSVSTPSGTITAVGSDWYRITFTTGSALAVTIGSGIGISDAKGNTYVTASGTNGVLVWGAQLEAGSYPTSYIPTTSASVTRVADAAYKTGISSLIGQTEGTLFGEFNKPIDPASAVRLNINDTTFDNWVFVGFEAQSMRAYLRANNTVILSQIFSTTSNVNKIAIAYKSGDYAIYHNGTQIATGTSAFSFTSTLSFLNFGDNPADSNIYAPCQVAQSVLFKTRLTNAELASLTTL